MLSLYECKLWMNRHKKRPHRHGGAGPWRWSLAAWDNGVPTWAGEHDRSSCLPKPLFVLLQSRQPGDPSATYDSYDEAVEDLRGVLSASIRPGSATT